MDGWVRLASLPKRLQGPNCCLVMAFLTAVFLRFAVVAIWCVSLCCLQPLRNAVSEGSRLAVEKRIGPDGPTVLGKP